jgi:hypothetical protein
LASSIRRWRLTGPLGCFPEGRHSGDKRAPIVEHAHKAAVVPPVASRPLRHIGEAHAARRGLDYQPGLSRLRRNGAEWKHGHPFTAGSGRNTVSTCAAALRPSRRKFFERGPAGALVRRRTQLRLLDRPPPARLRVQSGLASTSSSRYYFFMNRRHLKSIITAANGLAE